MDGILYHQIPALFVLVQWWCFLCMTISEDLLHECYILVLYLRFLLEALLQEFQIA